MKQTVQKRYFEEIEVGERYVSEGRTISESDIYTFAGLSGDFNRLHMNEEYMKNSIFGRRIAHGLLILAIQSGLGAQIVRPDIAVMAFLGISEWNFRKPVFIGDTIYVQIEIVEKRETSKPDRGIIVWQRTVFNQHDEVVQDGKSLIMVHRKPKQADDILEK